MKDNAIEKSESGPSVCSMELLACPFCGGEAESDMMQGYRRMKDGIVSNAVAIYCTKCTVQMTMCHGDVSEYTPEDILIMLTEAWNLRQANNHSVTPIADPK